MGLLEQWDSSGIPSLPLHCGGIDGSVQWAHLEEGKEDGMTYVGFISPLWQTTAVRDCAHPSVITKMLPRPIISHWTVIDCVKPHAGIQHFTQGKMTSLLYKKKWNPSPSSLSYQKDKRRPKGSRKLYQTVETFPVPAAMSLERTRLGLRRADCETWVMSAEAWGSLCSRLCCLGGCCNWSCRPGICVGMLICAMWMSSAAARRCSFLPPLCCTHLGHRLEWTIPIIRDLSDQQQRGQMIILLFYMFGLLDKFLSENKVLRRGTACHTKNISITDEKNHEVECLHQPPSL